MPLPIYSVPHLFAVANHLDCIGSHRCFYCGAPCEEQFAASEYVKDSFTGHSEVSHPGSSWVCQGCVLCLREAFDVPMLDGTIRPTTKAATRAWSWEVTATRTRAGSKADIAHWRAICLTPPIPPFAIVLSDSGQKHLLYRGVVNHSREYVTVTLETQRISYHPEHLCERIALCSRICAVSSKPALSEPMDWRLASLILAAYDDGEAIIDQWQRVWEEPLSHLAKWLCGNKESCQHEYPCAAIGAA